MADTPSDKPEPGIHEPTLPGVGKVVDEPTHKSESEPPRSPRTGRLLDTYDKIPDLDEVTSHSGYRKLEAVVEAFFLIDKEGKRNVPLDVKKYDDAKLLAVIEEHPYHFDLMIEFLRRTRKGIIPITVLQTYISDQETRKRELVYAISGRIDAGNLTIPEPTSDLEKSKLHELLTNLFESEFISPDDVLRYCNNAQLNVFMLQGGYKDRFHVSDLPAVKAPAPGTPVPPEPPRAARVKPRTPLKRATTIVSATVPPAPGSAPMPSTNGLPPPAEGSGLKLPQGGPARRLPQRLSPKAFNPVIKDSTDSAEPLPVTRREGPSTGAPESIPSTNPEPAVARATGRDPHLTVSDPEATREALGRDDTILATHEVMPPGAIPTIPPPTTASPSAPPPELAGAVIVPDVIEVPLMSVPVVTVPPSPKTDRNFPPPGPKIEKIGENPAVHLASVDIIQKGETSESAMRLALIDKGEAYKIGTDPRNDIVLAPDAADSIAEFHGEIVIDGDTILVRGEKGIFRVASIDTPDRKRRGLVLNEPVQVDPNEPVLIGGRGRDGKEGAYQEIRINLEQPFLVDEVKEQYSRRCKKLLEIAGSKLVECIEEMSIESPNLEVAAVFQAKTYLRKAQELFLLLSDLIPDEVRTDKFDIWRGMALQNAEAHIRQRLGLILDAHQQELKEAARKKVQEALAFGKRVNDIQLNTEIPRSFQRYLDLAADSGIDVKVEDFHDAIDHAQGEGKRFLAMKKKEELDQEEAIARQAALELDEIQRPLREHQEALTRFKVLHMGVHFAEGEELLTENTQFAHIGPALIISDPHGKVVIHKPLLVGHETIGSHGINTIELAEDFDPKHGTKPFMVSIEFDGKNYQMTWIDGSLSFTTKEIPMSPTFQVEYNRTVTLGKFLLKIEQNHAYTHKYISKNHANPHAEELCEIIFDHNITTLEQTRRAYDELKTLASHPGKLVDLDALKVHLGIKIAALWEKIGSWHTALPMAPPPDAPDEAPDSTKKKRILADSQYLGTLALLLKDRGSFIPRTESLSRATINQAALNRFMGYLGLDKESKEPASRTDKMLGAIGLFKGAEEQKARQRLDAKARADIGVVEVARFLDMGLLGIDTVAELIPDTQVDYYDRIHEIYEIRRIIGEISNGGEKIDRLEDAMRLCEGKTMNEVFGGDEIAAFNVNIEINVSSKTPVIEYLKKLCVFLGRSNMRFLGNIDNEKNLTTIKKLLELKVVKPSELTTPPYFSGDDVLEAIHQAELVAGMRKEELASAAAIRDQKAVAFHNHMEAARKQRLILIDKVNKVADVLNETIDDTKLDVLLAVADIITDPLIDREMDGDHMTLAKYVHNRSLPTAKSEFKDRSEAIVTDTKLISWGSIKADYNLRAAQAGRKSAARIMAGEDALYESMLLKEALEKGIVNPTDIDQTVAELDAAVKAHTEKAAHDKKVKEYRSKYRPFFDENKNRSTDNLDYYDQIKLDEIKDPIELEIAKEMIENLGWLRMNNIINNIQKGEDVMYMKMVAKELIEKGFQPQKLFTAEEIALLQ